MYLCTTLRVGGLRDIEIVPPHLEAGPLRVCDLVLDEDEVLDRGRLLEHVLELGQELVRGDDVGDLGLVDAVRDGVVAEVGVQRDERERLLEAAQRAHQPLFLRLREDAHVLPEKKKWIE